MGTSNRVCEYANACDFNGNDYISYPIVCHKPITFFTLTNILYILVTLLVIVALTVMQTSLVQLGH